MISVNVLPVPESEKVEIEKWLGNPARLKAGSVVQSLIAKLEAEGSATAIKDPRQFLSFREIPDGTRRALIEAAEWRIFLQKLAELSSSDFKFITVKLTPSHEHTSSN